MYPAIFITRGLPLARATLAVVNRTAHRIAVRYGIHVGFVLRFPQSTGRLRVAGILISGSTVVVVVLDSTSTTIILYCCTVKPDRFLENTAIIFRGQPGYFLLGGALVTPLSRLLCRHYRVVLCRVVWCYHPGTIP